jgi:hypothetical protein
MLPNQDSLPLQIGACVFVMGKAKVEISDTTLSSVGGFGLWCVPKLHLMRKFRPCAAQFVLRYFIFIFILFYFFRLKHNASALVIRCTFASAGRTSIACFNEARVACEDCSVMRAAVHGVCLRSKAVATLNRCTIGAL